MADSTHDMCRSVYERELKSKFGNQKLLEITHEDLRALTDVIVERSAPATARNAATASAVVRSSVGSKDVGDSRPASTRRTSLIA